MLESAKLGWRALVPTALQEFLEAEMTEMLGTEKDERTGGGMAVCRALTARR
jgi:transposase-like protein